MHGLIQICMQWCECTNSTCWPVPAGTIVHIGSYYIITNRIIYTTYDVPAGPGHDGSIVEILKSWKQKSRNLYDVNTTA